MNSLRVLAPAEFRPMPWKNGGGRTTEIAVHPQGATLDAFDWRVSIAEVERDGPFSAFPGVDRVLVLLAGGGMRLSGPDGDLDVRTPFEPLAFAGDTPGDCALVDGPVRDFNVMTRRGRSRASVAVARESPSRLPAAATVVCYAAIGRWAVERAGTEAVAIPEGGALIASGGSGRLDLQPRDARAVALVVGFVSA